jgi:hypothetical protein
MKAHRFHDTYKNVAWCKAPYAASPNDHCVNDEDFEELAKLNVSNVCEKCRISFEKTAHLKSEKEVIATQAERLSDVIKKIKDIFKPMMDDWEVAYFNYITNLKDKANTWYKENKNERGFVDSNKLYRYYNEIGYTAEIRNLVAWSIDEQKKKIHKMASDKLLKVDVAVVKKLKNIVVETIESIHLNINSADGYAEGIWKINNTHIFEFHVIYAGGYNIQCLHYRTLYNLKEIK